MVNLPENVIESCLELFIVISTRLLDFIEFGVSFQCD
jgi:hypothetical protein